MAAFALVHGAWGGAWVWERVAAELERLGNRPLAVDLPCEDRSATFADYADAVAGAVRDAGEDEVVLVAHSLGGHTAALVPGRVGVRRIVYVAALLPLPGASFIDQLRAEPGQLVEGYDRGLEQGKDGSRWVDSEGARASLFSDCSDDDARAAFERLRFQAALPQTTPTELESFPEVESVYVACADDRTVSPDWGRRAARERLGVEAVELSGGHMPMIARPQALAAIVASGV